MPIRPQTVYLPLHFQNAPHSLYPHHTQDLLLLLLLIFSYYTVYSEEEIISFTEQ